jgi:hypothetical protein
MMKGMMMLEVMRLDKQDEVVGWNEVDEGWRKIQDKSCGFIEDYC